MYDRDIILTQIPSYSRGLIWSPIGGHGLASMNFWGTPSPDLAGLQVGTKGCLATLLNNCQLIHASPAYDTPPPNTYMLTVTCDMVVEISCILISLFCSALTSLCALLFVRLVKISYSILFSLYKAVFFFFATLYIFKITSWKVDIGQPESMKDLSKIQSSPLSH